MLIPHGKGCDYMDEFTFINRITPSSYRRKEIRKGIGDDAAIFRLRQADTVMAVDTFVEGVHFTKKTLTPAQIGSRLLRVNLSDLAAMGATPLCYLVSIVVPENADPSYIEAIFAGMETDAKAYGIDLIGGDTVMGRELTISLTIVGSVPEEKARLRSDARTGDVVFVTGTLGDSRAGLALLLQEKTIENDLLRQELLRAHQQPTPRIEFAQALRPLARVALNDISDGLANELHEIAESSAVSLTVVDAAVPVSEGLRLWEEERQTNYKYFGGEDFELVGTVSRDDFPFVQQAGERLGLAVTKIGTVDKAATGGAVFVEKNGHTRRLQKYGYVHKSRDKDENHNEQ